ncbi:MAG: sulfotransferase domain-containing protein [Kiloniellales bacterium]|nr:sulfotransferase domain-containing protein [Kiloniellales bacterium]
MAGPAGFAGSTRDSSIFLIEFFKERLKVAKSLISDKARRRSILWPTAYLPAPLRITLRRKFLADLELHKARNTPAIIIGHQKCGNTWLRAMLSRFYQMKYDIPSNLILKSDEFQRINDKVPRIFCTNGHYSYQHVIADAFDPATRDPYISSLPVLFIARHPCDIAVSWYLQFTKRESTAKVELINADLKTSINGAQISLWDFVRHSELGVNAMIDYLNAWYDRLHDLETVHWTSYESMRLDPRQVLTRVLSFYEEDYTEDQISEALKFTSFDNLQRLEQDGHFQAGGLARQSKSDPTKRKVRRGKIGGYREDFDAERVAELDELVEKRLNPAFGYTKAEFDAMAKAAG